MELRKIFDTIPEQFDKFRPKYSAELFEFLINFAQLGPDRKVLEIGPGFGALTQFLTEDYDDVTALEIDPFAIGVLKKDIRDGILCAELEGWSAAVYSTTVF